MLQKILYPIVGGLLVASSLSSYFTGDFGTKPVGVVPLKSDLRSKSSFSGSSGGTYIYHSSTYRSGGGSSWGK